MKGPAFIPTARLVLRKPTAADAQAIFDRYASDPDVTRYMSWPTHRTVEDTRTFLAWSDTDWDKWPAGSYLIFDQASNRLLGGTGLSFESPTHAITGYVLARDAWGQGYASEALASMVELAGLLGVKRLEASVHPHHRASAHVLEKGGFMRERTHEDCLEFPNIHPGVKSGALCYVLLL